MEPRDTQLLHQLAATCGILDGYHDIWGEYHTTSDATRRAVLAAMGLSLDDGPDLGELIAGVETEQAAPPPAWLATAPPRGYHPPVLENGGRTWGINLALYGLRSARNWGVGDFGDLLTAADWAADLGAEFLGLLPLHDLFNQPPHGISPYFPSSRLFLNPLYISVDALPETASPELRRLLGSESVQSRLSELRSTPLVDYTQAWELKAEVLAAVFRRFRDPENSGVDRANAFAAWRKTQGEPLEHYATFCALREHLTDPDGHPLPWPRWPQPYCRPDGVAVEPFRAAHAARVTFHAWLQWLAEEQLAAVHRRCLQRGMGIGLYLDTALGIDPCGADAWVFQDVLARGASAGAPPDPFSLLGQRWGVPPAVPTRHRASGYGFLHHSLGRNAARAGALRIDHVLAFWRLFWVPEGLTPAEGAYVRDRPEELLAVARAVSCEQSCLIVGEDLGTVPPEVRVDLASSGLFSYRVLIFEKDDHGFFHPPAHYPAQALVSATTHDLPPLDAFWLGDDLELKRRLGRYPDSAAEDHDGEVRRWDRFRLQEKLRDEGLLPDGLEPSFEVDPQHLDALATAVHAYLARTPAALLLVNADDLLGERNMQNLPGTLEEHPNWQRKGSVPLEQWPAATRPGRVAEAIQREGRGQSPL